MTDQLKANKVARLLSDRQLKYTVVLVKKSGQVFEFQSETVPTLSYDKEARTVMVMGGEYNNHAICTWDDVEIILHEENPK